MRWQKNAVKFNVIVTATIWMQKNTPYFFLQMEFPKDGFPNLLKKHRPKSRLILQMVTSS